MSDMITNMRQYETEMVDQGWDVAEIKITCRFCSTWSYVPLDALPHDIEACECLKGTPSHVWKVDDKLVRASRTEHDWCQRCMQDGHIVDAVHTPHGWRCEMTGALLEDVTAAEMAHRSRV